MTHLSPREQEVLELIANGQETKQIAPTLNVAENTVKIFRTNILEKLGAVNMPHAVAIAFREGLLN